MQLLPADPLYLVGSFSTLLDFHRILRPLNRHIRQTLDAQTVRHPGDETREGMVVLILIPRVNPFCDTGPSVPLRPVQLIVTNDVCQLRGNVHAVLGHVRCQSLESVHVCIDGHATDTDAFQTVCTILKFIGKQPGLKLETLVLRIRGSEVPRLLVKHTATIIQECQGCLRMFHLHMPLVGREDIRYTRSVVQSLQHCSRLTDVALHTGNLLWYNRTPGLLLGVVCRIPQLRHLDISTSAPLDALQGAIGLRTLRLRVQIPRTLFESHVVQLDRALRRMEELRDFSLVLHRTSSPLDLRLGLPFLRSRQLKRLHVCMENGAASFVHAIVPNNAGTFSLEIDWCVSTELLCALQQCQNPSLEIRARYSNTNISGYRALARCLGSPGRHAVTLDLRHGRMSMALLDFVQDIPFAPDLRCLCLLLDDNGMEDAMCMALMQTLFHCIPGLQSLEIGLSENPLSGACLDAAVDILVHPRWALRSLVLHASRLLWSPPSDAEPRWPRTLTQAGHIRTCVVLVERCNVGTALPGVRPGLVWQWC